MIEIVCLFKIETIGVGDEKYTVRITTETALKHFLLSDHSLKVWSSTEIDIRNISNMFNIPISVFTYNLPGYPSTHWNTIQPDSVIGPNSEYRHWGVGTFWLINCHLTHYDLLVARPPAMMENNLQRIQVENNNYPVVEDREPDTRASSSSASSLEELTVSSISHYNVQTEDAFPSFPSESLTPSSPVIPPPSPSIQSAIFSPMDFIRCPRGKGRPRGQVRFGAPSINKNKRKQPDESGASDIPIEPKKKRGRPQGSKNKEKGTTQEKLKKNQAQSSKTKKSAPFIDTVPNDPLDCETEEIPPETTFTRIIKASNAAYDDTFDDNSFYDNSFDESVYRDAIRQEMC